MRSRLLFLLTVAIAAGVVAVATAGTGHEGKKVAGTTTRQGAETMPTMPTTQPSPPTVQTQPTPPPPSALGNLPPINDLRDRRKLDAFIAERPELAPWKEDIWYVAHYSYSNISARGLAGLMWCIAFRIPACSREEDAEAARGVSSR
jgi:hypothetical protein